MIRKQTQMQKSPSKFEASTVCEPITGVTLDHLERLQISRQILVRIKVVSERDVLELKDGLKKQDLSKTKSYPESLAKITIWCMVYM